MHESQKITAKKVTRTVFDTDYFVDGQFLYSETHKSPVVTNTIKDASQQLDEESVRVVVEGEEARLKEMEVTDPRLTRVIGAVMGLSIEGLAFSELVKDHTEKAVILGIGGVVVYGAMDLAARLTLFMKIPERTILKDRISRVKSLLPNQEAEISV